MAGPAIGLYIGTESADLVQLGGTFQKPRLINFVRAPLPSQAAWRSKIRAEESGIQGMSAKTDTSAGSQVELDLAKSVKSLLQKIGSSSVKAYTSVSPESVVIRYFQMPTIPAHERKLAVSFEAKKYLPFKLEELVTDFQVIVRKADPTLMRIMFFGIKKTSVNSYMSLFQSSNVSPLCMEAAPISLIRLLRQTGQLPPDQVAAVLSLEKDTATISVAGDNLLYLSRNVTIVSSSEAGGQDEPSAELMEALINETRVSVDYYRRRFLGEPGVGKVILFGQGVDSKKIEEMAATLDLPVELGDPFKKLTGSTKDIPLNSAIAIGLALRALEKHPGEPNILPPESRSDTSGLLKPAGASLGAMVVLLGLSYFLTVMDLSSREQKTNALKKQEILIQSAIPGTSLADLQAVQVRQAAQLQFLRNVLQLPKDHTKLLVQTTSLLPKESWLIYLFLDDNLQLRSSEEMTFDRKKLLRLAGGSYFQNQAKEFESVNNFLAALRVDPVFQAAFTGFNLDAVQRAFFNDEEISEFRLTCASNPQDVKSSGGQGIPEGWAR